MSFTAYNQVQWERNCQLAAAVIIVYEYLVHFTDEVEFFWSQRWSIGKALFLWSRYYSTSYNIANAVVFAHTNVTQGVSTKFFYWQNFGSALQYITTHVILELRLYAMYGKNKKLLTFFAVLLCCESIVFGVLFGLHRDGLVGTNNPLPGVFICADADPPHEHWIAYAPTTVLIVETILLSLALNKAWEHYKDHAGGKLIPWLTKQSVYFFIPIFFIHLTTQIIWIVNKITLNELFTGYSFAIPAVLANRLMLSIRKRGAQPDYPSDIMPTQGSMIFPQRSISRHHEGTTINDTPIELTSFNNGRGLG